MSTSSKIPATDRSAGGPGSSHANRDKGPNNHAGAHHQNQKDAARKHPNEQTSTGAGGTVHEKRKPGEGGRS